MRLIDADVLMRKFKTASPMAIDGRARQIVNDMPTIEERKRGKWIFIRGEEAGNALYECSECGKGDIHAPEVRVPYCWHCGAQMEVEHETQTREHAEML